MRALKALTGAALAMATFGFTPAYAQGPSKQNFKMVGTWNFTTHYKEIEQPFFAKQITTDSDGKVKVDIKSITELGLSGFEIVDLTRKGVYDIVAGVVAYAASKSPALEGIDLTGVMPEFAEAKKATEVYRDVVAAEFEKKYGVKLLAMFGYPSQQFWCAKPINQLSDLKGMKTRVYGSSMGDLVKGLGGVPVTISFAEVVPALQKGVADCGITGTLPAYDAKWRDVVTNVYKAGLGWAPSFAAMNLRRWNSLDKPTQEFLKKEFAEFERKAWIGVKENDEQGLICNTGQGGKCRFGEPGHIKLVTPTPEDRKALNAVVEKDVLSAWAKRCGDECVKKWNETVGKVVGLTAKAH
ncbi:MAG: TRAP transporter substrate-binding protein [Hyphomicrobiaceae bacterium]